jgi:triacylglycerol esterase/lipase EstA (alpha/beta hydrolase family)
MIELFSKISDGTIDSATIEEFRDFVAKHSVTQVEELKVVLLAVHPERPKRAVIFVHGWNGDANSFGEMPKWIEARTGWKTGVFSYPTGIISHSSSIALTSASFDNWVRGSFPEAQLAIVAHSMGGVVVRHSLTEEPLRETPLNLRLLVLCASPENGAVLASMGKSIPGLASVQLRELDTNSPFLFGLNKWWDKWVADHVPARCRVRSIVGDSDKVVSINNARGTDRNPVPVLGAGHIDLVKPKSDSAEIIVTISRWIHELDKSTANRKSAQSQPRA